MSSRPAMTPRCNARSKLRASRAASWCLAISFLASTTWPIPDGLKSIALRSASPSGPDPDWLWGQRYPDAVYHLVTSTPAAIDAIGGDELLYADGIARGTPYVAFKTLPTNEVRFAVVGSMTDPAEAQRLADKYAAGVEPAHVLESANAFWTGVIGKALQGPSS